MKTITSISIWNLEEHYNVKYTIIHFLHFIGCIRDARMINLKKT